MGLLARWGGYLAIAGGAVMTVLLVVVTFGGDPDSPAWNLFFLVVALLGAGALGLAERTKGVIGQLGRVSAWVSALGALGLLLVGAYAMATGQYSTSATGDDPLLPLWIVTSLAWLLGALGFAAALVRARALSPIGAWLVLVGAVVGTAASIAGGENPPPALFLVFVLFAVGWILLGYAATREPAG